jgi:uncharacterized protein YecT (DUF1311 family)
VVSVHPEHDGFRFAHPACSPVLQNSRQSWRASFLIDIAGFPGQALLDKRNGADNPHILRKFGPLRQELDVKARTTGFFVTFRHCFPLLAGVLAILACLTIRISAPRAAGVDGCDSYYFGLSGAPDYAKALKCYEEQKSLEFIILMHLNGEGTPADVRKASELFKAWEKSSPEETTSLQGESLRKAIEERMSNPDAPHARLDYCNDIAVDTPSIDFCGQVNDQIAEKRFKNTIASVKGKLSEADAAALDRVTESFNAFKEAEGRRTYQRYIDGTIRNTASYGQTSLLRDNFLKLVAETVEQTGLRPLNYKDYKAADKHLNDAYRESLSDYAKNYEDLLGNGGNKEDREIYNQNIKQFREYSKSAQLCWIKYRDLFAQLASSLYRDRKNDLDPVLSMKTVITRIRVSELQNDPEGGQ